MNSATGIELGPDYCVLVRARRRAGGVELGALLTMEPPDWPQDAAARVALLDKARVELGLPRRSHVVTWNVDPAESGPTARDIVAAAGFSVESVLSPADALRLLALSRASRSNLTDTARIWFSVNRHGAAIAVVASGRMLYATELAWRIKAPVQRAQADLLRRYLMVAELVPELRNAMDHVRRHHAVEVDAAIACGAIADLRTLTMPLIQQLDVEIETLDTPLHLESPRAAGDVLVQCSAILRLAAAAAAVQPKRPVRTAASIAAAALALGVGGAWWVFSISSDDLPGDGAIASRGAAGPLQSGRVEPASAVTDRLGPAATDLATPRPQPTSGIYQGPPMPAPGAGIEVPLPSVTGILVSVERRLAIVNGRVVGAGDRIGDRVVDRIDSDGVVFRETSGRLVRVALRDKAGPRSSRPRNARRAPTVD